jgi:hypothetical protein
LQKPPQAGDVLIWYTDRVIEAQDPGGTPYESFVAAQEAAT